MNQYSVRKLPADVLLELANKHTVLRRQQSYSQAELAKRSGVSLGSLRRFEQTGKISLEHLLLLTHVLQRLQDFEHVLEAGEDMKEVEKLFSQKNDKMMDRLAVKVNFSATAIDVGELVRNEKNIYFKYDEDFLKGNLKFISVSLTTNYQYSAT